MIIASVDTFEHWRERARGLLSANVPPDQIDWRNADTAQSSLFSAEHLPSGHNANIHISKEVMALLNRLACHRDERRWAWMYQAVWRIKEGEKNLPQLFTDPLMHKLKILDGEIRRDAHKTKAFVRFRAVRTQSGEHYVAWHRPDHRVLPIVTPFFQRRFTSMSWTIMTPDESVTWDEKKLTRGLGVAAQTVNDDEIEALWLTYYGSTFNPARVNVAMMKREMPVRHWKTLPETALIPKLLANASIRVDRMIDQQEGFSTSAAQFIPENKDYKALKEAARHCQGCPLHCAASQTVFGKGPTGATIMVVGEQPGDQEDEVGEAFVGPAGRVLDTILEEIKIPRSEMYVTNAVKHFKFVQRGNKRIHQSPSVRETIACKPWLIAEIDAIRPKLIVTLGVTAARALVHQGFSLKQDSGNVHKVGTIPLFATWHPSAILRAPDALAQATITDHLKRTFLTAWSTHAPSGEAMEYLPSSNQ